jgi:hypothetical protein
MNGVVKKCKGHIVLQLEIRDAIEEQVRFREEEGLLRGCDLVRLARG